MKILLTGFEPFSEDLFNPSWEAVKLLPEQIEERQIIKTCLPVVFGKAADMLIEKIRETKPDAVICTGLAGGRKAVTPELIAVNLRSAGIPDNDGQQPVWEKILEDGEDGIFTKLPVREMKTQLLAAGIPAEISYSAGTYVCNEVMYRLLHYAGHENENPGMKAGFIHVPYAKEYLAEGKDAFALPVKEIAKALAVCVAVL